MSWNRPITDEEWMRIEQYFDGELAEPDLSQFNKLLQDDPSFSEAVESVRLIRLGIAEEGLKQRLSQFHQELTNSTELTQKTPPRKLFTRMNWAAAAAVVVLVTTLGWWWINGSSRLTESEKLFQAYYQPDPGLLTAMGPAEDYEFQQAMVEYKSGNFRKAAKAWEKLAAQPGASDTVQYFLASAWLGEKQWDKAEPLLKQVTGKTPSAFAADAAWYLGLLELRKGNNSQAISWIEQSNHPSKQALLSALKP